MSPTVRTIQQVTAGVFRVPLESMTTKFERGLGKDGRNRFEYSHPRQAAMYVASKLTTKTMGNIGLLFGGRDHSTVIHAIRVTEKRMKTDKVLRSRVELIKERAEAVENPLIPYCEPARTESLECPMKPTKTEWYERQNDERRAISPVYTEIMRRESLGPNVRDEDRVYRDPCIKCGTRGDIGCVHTRVAA